MENLGFLFDMSKYDRRKTLSQIEFEKTNKEVLLAFPAAVDWALKRTHEEMSTIEPICIHPNLPATHMAGFVSGKMKMLFPDQCPLKATRRFMMITRTSCLYVKKLDKNLRPSNIETFESTVILNQRSTSSDDTLTNIFLGWTATEDYSQITGKYAVCIDGNNVLWYLNLTSFGSTGDPTTDAVPPTTTDPQISPAVEIKIKTN